MNVQSLTSSLVPEPATGPESLRRSWLLFLLLGGALIVVGRHGRWGVVHRDADHRDRFRRAAVDRRSPRDCQLLLGPACAASSCTCWRASSTSSSACS